MHLEGCEIIAENMWICVVALAVSTLPSHLCTSTNAIELLGLRRAEILALARAAWPYSSVFILLIAVQPLLDALYPSVDR
jgi:hypothetical protein